MYQQHLTEAIINNIRSATDAATQTGKLASEWLDIIYSKNWFNVYVPRLQGGLGYTLPDAVALLEELAAADAGFGWTITLCSGANWFIGFLPGDVQKTFFADRTTCLAGSGLPGGEAEITTDGYKINGYWKYATGAPHATAFTCNCYIRNHNELVKDVNNEPVVKSFIFTREEVQIENDWQPMGMKATGSYSFRVTELWVPANRSFEILPVAATLPDPIFQFPFLPFAEITLAANFSGMALHWLQCFDASVRQKWQNKSLSPDQHLHIEEMSARVSKNHATARTSFFERLSAVWQQGVDKKAWQETELNDLRYLSQQLVRSSLHCVQQLFPYSGMEAATEGSDLNRIWLDIHTARQHSLFRHI